MAAQRAGMKMYVSQSVNGLRRSLTYHTDIYSVESEVSACISYAYRDGEFAIINGRQSVRLRPDVVDEMLYVLNDIKEGESRRHGTCRRYN